MRQRVLVDIKVICDIPNHVGQWSSTLERRAELIEKWAREFAEFIRDHRSQDPVSLSVEREYQDQCSHCGREWEEDEDGPLCCSDAQPTEERNG